MTMYKFFEMIATRQPPLLRARLLVHLAAYKVHDDLQKVHDDFENAMTAWLHAHDIREAA